MIVPTPPALMDFADPLDGADNASDIGSNWRPDHLFMKLVTNRAQLRTPGSGNGRTGAWETYAPANSYNGGRLLTDNWCVEAQLSAPVGTASTSMATCIGAGMLDAGPGTGMILVYLLVSLQSNGGILTYSANSIVSSGAASQATGQTVRSSKAGNVSTNAKIRLERRMYSATQSTFMSYIDDVFYVGWDDSGGVVPAGNRMNRRWFMQTEAQYPNFQSAQYAPALVSVRAWDVKG